MCSVKWSQINAKWMPTKLYSWSYKVVISQWPTSSYRHGLVLRHLSVCLSSPGAKRGYSFFVFYAASMRYFPVVINYKTCTLQTHSSPCLFAPFVSASAFIYLRALPLSSEFSIFFSLCCSLSPHFTSSFCLLRLSPFKLFPSIGRAFLIYCFSSAFAVYLHVSVSSAPSKPHISLFLVLAQSWPIRASLLLFEVLLNMQSFCLGPAE